MPESVLTTSSAQHRFLDDTYGVADFIAEFREDLRHGLILDGLDVVKRYSEGALNVLINVRDVDLGDIEFVYIAMPRIDPVIKFGELAARNEKASQFGVKADQIGVFVDNVEIVKDSQAISISSIVWFNVGNSCTNLFGNFLAFFPERDFKFRNILPMREIRVLRRSLRQYGALTHCLVETGSQVVQGVCCGEPKFAGNWLRKPNSDLVAPRLRVRLGHNSYDVRIGECLKGRAEIGDVAFGPFNL